MATVTYNGRVITQLQGGKTGVIDFADEKMRGDITVEASTDTEVRYKGAVLGKGRKIIIHCAGKIMRGEMRIAAAGRLKLDAPVIYISKKLDAPVIYIESATDGGGTLAILGKAILGKAILGDDGTYAILGRAILGMAVLGKGGKTKLTAPVIALVSGDKLDAPVIELVSGEKLDAPIISLYKDNQLDAPVIYLQTEDDLIKLDAPVIYLETESDLIKLDTPTIYIETEDVPDEPDVPDLEKLDAPEIYIYTEEEPDEPIIVKLDAPVIYIEAEAIPKLDAPEIYLESDPVVPDEPETSGVTWNKYNCNTTTIYDQTDAYVGDTGSHTVWDGQGLFTAYAFSEEEGFYYPDGFDHYVVYEDASQAAGAYTLQNNEGDVYVESGVWQLGAIIEVHDQYDRKGYTYETTCVASADAHYFYSKGDTLIGTVEAAEGEKPASGEVLDSGNGWYIIRTSDGIFYYEREDK